MNIPHSFTFDQDNSCQQLPKELEAKAISLPICLLHKSRVCSIACPMETSARGGAWQDRTENSPPAFFPFLTYITPSTFHLHPSAFHTKIALTPRPQLRTSSLPLVRCS